MALSLSPVPAGPAYELDDTHELIDLNALITRNRDGVVAYEITGDSAVPIIQPGSIAFVDTAAIPESGDMVVVSVNGLNCVKRLEIKRNGLFLVSANTAYAAAEITEADTFYVLGKILGALQMF